MFARKTSSKRLMQKPVRPLFHFKPRRNRLFLPPAAEHLCRPTLKATLTSHPALPIPFVFAYDFLTERYSCRRRCQPLSRHGSYIFLPLPATSLYSFHPAASHTLVLWTLARCKFSDEIHRYRLLCLYISSPLYRTRPIAICTRHVPLYATTSMAYIPHGLAWSILVLVWESAVRCWRCRSGMDDVPHVERVQEHGGRKSFEVCEHLAAEPDGSDYQYQRKFGRLARCLRNSTTMGSAGKEDCCCWIPAGLRRAL